MVFFGREAVCPSGSRARSRVTFPWPASLGDAMLHFSEGVLITNLRHLLSSSEITIGEPLQRRGQVEIGARSGLLELRHPAKSCNARKDIGDGDGFALARKRVHLAPHDAPAGELQIELVLYGKIIVRRHLHSDYGSVSYLAAHHVAGEIIYQATIHQDFVTPPQGRKNAGNPAARQNAPQRIIAGMNDHPAAY